MSIRFRLTFDRDLTSDALPRRNRHIIYQPHFLPPDIGGLASLIQHDFGINTPEGLALSVDMWKLPPGSSTALLRDDDTLKVAQSTEPSLQMGRDDPGRGILTQPAGAAPAAPSNPGATTFVSASSGQAAIQLSMPAVSLPIATAPALEQEESVDPAEVDAARAIYEKVMENIRVPGTLGAPLPQAGEASGPAASQPSMPAVSLLPAAPPAFGPKDSTSEEHVDDAEVDAARVIYEEVIRHFPKPRTPDPALLPAAAPASEPEDGTSEEHVDDAKVDAARVIYEKVIRRFPRPPSSSGTPGQASGSAASQTSVPAVSLPPPAIPDSEEIPDAENDAAPDVSEKVMQNFPGKPSTPGTILLHAGQASDQAGSQPSMPAISLPPANTPAMRPKVSEEKMAWFKIQRDNYDRVMAKFPCSQEPWEDL